MMVIELSGVQFGLKSLACNNELKPSKTWSFIISRASGSLPIFTLKSHWLFRYLRLNDLCNNFDLSSARKNLAGTGLNPVESFSGFLSAIKKLQSTCEIAFMHNFDTRHYIKMHFISQTSMMNITHLVEAVDWRQPRNLEFISLQFTLSTPRYHGGVFHIPHYTDVTQHSTSTYLDRVSGKFVLNICYSSLSKQMAPINLFLYPLCP